MNNNIYGMTGGQASPTTPIGSWALTMPYGAIDPAFDICKLAEGGDRDPGAAAGRGDGGGAGGVGRDHRPGAAGDGERSHSRLARALGGGQRNRPVGLRRQIGRASCRERV